MFKVKQDEYTNKTFRIPNELLKRLENLVDSKNISLNKLVIQCCEYALENLKDDDNEHV